MNTNYTNHETNLLQIDDSILSVNEETTVEISNRPINVYCDVCNESSRGTKAGLINRGWGLYPTSALCPTHESEVV